jgi:signal transduction histidine kinase
MRHFSGPRRDAIKRSLTFLYRTHILPKSADEDAARKEYILNIILVTSILMLIILSGIIFYHAMLHGRNYSGVAHIKLSVFLTFFILLYALSRRGQVAISSYLLIVTLFLSDSYAAYQWGVDLPVTLLAYAFIVCTSGILIGTAFGFVMTTLTASAIASVWYLHISGIVGPGIAVLHSQYPTDDDITALIIFYFLIMMVSWLSNHEIEKSLSRARISEISLKEERDFLEARVAARTDELRKVQFEELEREHRFAKFGKSASGLFHDLLNLLNAISLRTEGNAAEETSLATAYSTTHRIQQFMHGIQKQLDEKNICISFSLAEEAEQAIQLITHKANKENIRIVFLHDKNESLICWGVPFKFHQIVINLIGNAIDAYHSVPQNKALRRTVIIRIATKDGFFVLTVEDQACGIPQAIQEMIFKPFFTTKGETQGSGIGLTSIKKIIEEDFSGTIGVKSAEHVGSLFTVTLPIHIPPKPIEPLLPS